MSINAGLWDQFVDFAYDKKAEHEWLFPKGIDKDTLAKMLGFHCCHKNLHIVKNDNDWAFVVLRPIKHAFDVEFTWEQPDSSLYLLDFLYSKCRHATLKLWSMFYSRGIKPSSILYYRKGELRECTPKLVLKFLHSALVKE
jgi:hypothetical protein